MKHSIEVSQLYMLFSIDTKNVLCLTKASKKSDFYHFGVWPPLESEKNIFYFFGYKTIFWALFEKNVFLPLEKLKTLRKIFKICLEWSESCRGGCVGCTAQRVGRPVRRVGRPAHRVGHTTRHVGHTRHSWELQGGGLEGPSVGGWVNIHEKFLWSRIT